METLRMRISTQNRGGKTVTVIAGFTRELRLMEDLVSDLKRKLGTGGTFRFGVVELQGDVRARVRPLLAALGYGVKG